MGTQLKNAHEGSILFPVDLELDTDEKVCAVLKVNDCFAGPLKAIHIIKRNLPEGFVL